MTKKLRVKFYAIVKISSTKIRDIKKIMDFLKAFDIRGY